jgi:hypothetical protein
MGGTFIALVLPAAAPPSEDQGGCLEIEVGISSPSLFDRRAWGGKIDDEKRMPPQPSPARSRPPPAATG